MAHERRIIRIGILCAAAALLSSAAQGDLPSLTEAFEDNGFQAVYEAGVSGLRSSYHGWAQSGSASLPAELEVLGPDRVAYPYGIGERPSPATAVARNFDEAALGVKTVDGDLVVQVAGGLDPVLGCYYDGWQTWYGQGDVFVTVEDGDGVSHFALLNRWPRDDSGNPRTLDGGHFDAAQEFHTRGGFGGTSLEGRLVALSDRDDVVLTGGTGAYDPTYVPCPEGLDYRAYAQAGTDLGDALLDTTGRAWDEGLADVPQTWYIQRWTFPLEWLSSDASFQIGLHKVASCGNDQIGMVAGLQQPPPGPPVPIPVPGAAVLACVGLATLACLFRKPGRFARPAGR